MRRSADPDFHGERERARSVAPRTEEGVELAHLQRAGLGVRAEQEEEELVLLPTEEVVRLPDAALQGARRLDDRAERGLLARLRELGQVREDDGEDGEADSVAARALELPRDDVVEVLPYVKARHDVPDPRVAAHRAAILSARAGPQR